MNLRGYEVNREVKAALATAAFVLLVFAAGALMIYFPIVVLFGILAFVAVVVVGHIYFSFLAAFK